MADLGVSIASLSTNSRGGSNLPDAGAGFSDTINELSSASPVLMARTPDGAPYRVAPAEMYTLATIAALEAGTNDLSGQMEVAAVVTNRLNASNWTEQFGSSLTDQLFARASDGYQFKVISNYGINRSDFDSLSEASATLARAKGISTDAARQTIVNFINAAGNPNTFGEAVSSVGDNTGFRGVNGNNVFRRESPYDPASVGSRQPSAVEVNWPGGSRPF